MQQNFFFWASIFTTILSFALLVFSIWQYKEGQKQKDKVKSQVKVWMQDANGISQGLKRIIADNLTGRYSSTNDVCNAVWALEAASFSLYQSLYEERCITEEEYKQRQKKFMEKLDKDTFGETDQNVKQPQKQINTKNKLPLSGK